MCQQLNMHRRLLIFTVGLAAAITLKPIPTIAQQSAGQPKSERSNQDQSKTDNKGNAAAEGQESLQSTTRPNAPPLRHVREVNADQASSNPGDQPQSPWRIASRPETWPNWALVVLAGIAAFFSIKAFIAARRQADAAEKQLALASSPRLFVSKVRATNLEGAGQPVFFVKIVNSGPADATEVVVSIRVESKAGGVKYTIPNHKIMIPANASREFFIKWPEQLSPEDLSLFNCKQFPLRVKGSVCQHNCKPIEYCYKYNVWDGERPKGVPQFIPCDFDTARTALKIGKVTADAVLSAPRAAAEESSKNPKDDAHR